MDDDKLMRDIDFSNFEEEFKLSTAPVVKKDNTATDGTQLGISNGTGTIRFVIAFNYTVGARIPNTFGIRMVGVVRFSNGIQNFKMAALA